MVYQNKLPKKHYIKLQQNYQLNANLLREYNEKSEIKKLTKTEVLKNIESFKKDLFNLRDFKKIMDN